MISATNKMSGVEEKEHVRHPRRRTAQLLRHLTSRSLFCFGVITDVQYADTSEIGVSFWGRRRFYRNALQKCKRAAAAWHHCGCNFAINLGDSIDRISEDHCKDLAEVVDALESHHAMPVHHCIGNHELSSIKRETLIRILGLPGQSYHSTCPAQGWRLIFLDTYDLAVKAWPSSHPKSKETHALLERGKAAASDKTTNLERVRPFLDHPEMNGGVGNEQLAW